MVFMFSLTCLCKDNDKLIFLDSNKNVVKSDKTEVLKRKLVGEVISNLDNNCNPIIYVRYFKGTYSGRFSKIEAKDISGKIVTFEVIEDDNEYMLRMSVTGEESNNTVPVAYKIGEDYKYLTTLDSIRCSDLYVCQFESTFFYNSSDGYSYATPLDSFSFSFRSVINHIERNNRVTLFIYDGKIDSVLLYNAPDFLKRLVN